MTNLDDSRRLLEKVGMDQVENVQRINVTIGHSASKMERLQSLLQLISDTLEYYQQQWQDELVTNEIGNTYYRRAFSIESINIDIEAGWAEVYIRRQLEND